MDINSLDRFVEAQEKMYPTAMKEIQAGKTSRLLTKKNNLVKISFKVFSLDLRIR